MKKVVCGWRVITSPPLLINRDMRKMILLFIAALLLAGCSSPKYLPSPILRQIDSVYKAHNVKDVIYVRDSIYIKEKGDTVYEYRDRWRERLVEKVDTVISEKTDTLYVEIPIEKQLTKLQQIKMDFADISMALCALLLVVLIVKKLILKR